MQGESRITLAAVCGAWATPDRIVDGLPGLYCLVRRIDGAILHWNRALEAFTGRRAGELDRVPLFDLLHPDDIAAVRGTCERMEPTDRADCEGRVLRADGTAALHHLAIHVVDWAKEPCLCLLGIDLSSRSRSEEALRRTRDMLIDGIESMSEGFAYFDADNQPLLFNARYRELTGGADTPDAVEQYRGLSAAAGGAATEHTPREVRTSDDRWLRIQQRPTRHGGTVDVRSDITELKQREQQLRDSAERYRSLVECSPDGVMVSESGRIRFVNPAGVRLAGATDADELIDGSLLDFVDHEMHPSIQKRLEAVTQGHSVQQFQYPLRRLDGRTRWIETRACAVQYEGRDAVMTVARDLTGRQRTEVRCRALFEGAPEPAIISDPQSGKIVAVNARAESLLGFQRAQLLGQRLDRFCPGCADATVEASAPQTTTVMGADDVEIPVEVHTNQVRDDAGRPLTQTRFRDLTEQHRREREAADQYHVLERIARGTPLNELAHDIAAMVERQCAGLRVAVLVRSGHALLAPDEHDAVIDAAVFERADASTIEGATAVPLPDSIAAIWSDPPRTGTFHGVPITDANGSLLGAIVYGPADHAQAPAHDERARTSLTEAIKLAAIAIEQDQLTNRLSHQAHHDALTGLPNRTLLMDRIDQALARAVRHADEVALVMLDLDGFKQINDRLGHATGDQLLEIVGVQLHDCLRVDDTVARLGGDEFVLVLPRSGMDQAARVAEKVLEMLATPIRIDEEELVTGASIGIALFPDDGNAPETLLQAADTAMYAAKTAGRNVYRFFAENMNTEVTERLRLESDLRAALDDGGLVIRYQPWVSLTSGNVRGAEALVRWRHPIHGLLYPRDFLAICEQARLHRRLDAWVLHQVALQAAAWLQLGRDWRIALNISPVELHDPGFMDMLIESIARSGIPPSTLEIEITEEGVMRNSAHTRKQLERLRAGAPGVRITLDDFGQGYCSLNNLRRLPIDTLKIDRTLIHELTHATATAGAQSMLHSIVELGHGLGMEVIAEGIEQSSQHEASLRAGCDYAQGFYYSAAVSAAGLEAYAERAG